MDAFLRQVGIKLLTEHQTDERGWIFHVWVSGALLAPNGE
jgi:hypothetical protein